MSSTSINLIRPVAGASTDLSAISRQIRLISWVLLGGFLILGIVSLLAYFVLRTNVEAVKREENNLVLQLSDLSRVEGLHQIVSARLGILENVVSSQADIDELLSLVSRISPDSGVSTVALDEDSGSVALKLMPRAISEASTVVGTLVEMSNNKEIIDARLVSIALDPDSRLTMTVSFNPKRN